MLGGCNVRRKTITYEQSSTFLWMNIRRACAVFMVAQLFCSTIIFVYFPLWAAIGCWLLAVALVVATLVAVTHSSQVACIVATLLNFLVGCAGIVAWSFVMDALTDDPCSQADDYFCHLQQSSLLIPGAVLGVCQIVIFALLQVAFERLRAFIRYRQAGRSALIEYVLRGGRRQSFSTTEPLDTESGVWHTTAPPQYSDAVESTSDDFLPRYEDVVKTGEISLSNVPRL